MAVLVWEGCKHSLKDISKNLTFSESQSFSPLAIAYAEQKVGYEWIMKTTKIANESEKVKEIRMGSMHQVLINDLNENKCLPGTFSIIEKINPNLQKIDFKKVIWICSIKK